MILIGFMMALMAGIAFGLIAGLVLFAERRQ
jgi:hypothetical protein